MNKSNQIKNYKGMQESPFSKGAGTRRVTGGSLKTNKGITLIALIITIIIMLILVGVTITVAVNGGLFNYAGRAGKETNEAIENEKLLAEGIINGQTIDDILGIAVKDDWYGITEEMETQEGVTEYHIQSCAELKKFANAVNAGNDFAGKTVYLDKNLDLQGNESKQWTPIGIDDNSFNGTFDGQNHFISGVYIEEESWGYYGLFGYVYNGNIENIGLINGYIKAKGAIGGIVGNFGNWELELSNYIKNCYNSCEIIGSDKEGTDEVGGIAGFSYGTIENCYNMGNVTCYTEGAGGIIGDAAYGIIKKCYNNGTITTKQGSSLECTYTGGIVGWMEEGDLVVEDCYNIGKVKGNIYAGGIAGEIDWGSEINNCYNIGQVEGTTVGRIVGFVYPQNNYGCIIANCYFQGENIDSATGEINDQGGTVTVNATPKTESEMKTQEFVDLLNAGQTPAPWKYVQNSYPILSWQK